MTVIELNHITKDYGDGKGIFDIQLSIKEGEVFGFVGTNGAGKTTTIRHMMGFLKPDKGRAIINGLDCWNDAAEVKKLVGYIPGEIAFPDAPTGTEFLKRQAQLLGIKNMRFAERIIDQLQLDPTANLKRMSKGMKQKTAIVAAFMADPDIYILDEPTTGLDPLMRREFMKLLIEEKKKGKTIFMSSHMFDEVENLCDRVAMIKDGKIIAIKNTNEIKHNEDKVYKIGFKMKQDYESFLTENLMIREKDEEEYQVMIEIHDREINQLFQILKKYDIHFISEEKFTLEQYFQSLYAGVSE